jgi:N-acyl-phosphatidylethanolamine-hydrolysing phospholipase D
MRVGRGSFTIFILILTGMLGCAGSTASKFAARTFEHLSDKTEIVTHKVSNPILADVGLSVLWIGHASVLIQIHDKVFVTDPVFTQSVGMLSRRVVEAGIDPGRLKPIDFVLISHTHFDHLSYASLSELPDRETLVIPLGAVRYVPDLGFRTVTSLKKWETLDEDGVRITAVPARHFSGRYGFDILWNDSDDYVGYVIQYKGRTVYFAGDTGYRDSLFVTIGERFSIDVALLPIAPLEPRAFMSRVHLDPERAVQAFGDLHAKLMIPIHHRTFIQGLEPRVTMAQEELENLVAKAGLQDRIYIMKIGERKIVQE